MKNFILILLVVLVMNAEAIPEPKQRYDMGIVLAITVTLFYGAVWYIANKEVK